MVLVYRSLPAGVGAWTIHRHRRFPQGHQPAHPSGQSLPVGVPALLWRGSSHVLSSNLASGAPAPRLGRYLFYILDLIHNLLQSLVVRFAMRLNQSEAVATALLVLIPLMATVANYRTMESWLLQLTQRAAFRLPST